MALGQAASKDLNSTVVQEHLRSDFICHIHESIHKSDQIKEIEKVKDDYNLNMSLDAENHILYERSLKSSLSIHQSEDNTVLAVESSILSQDNEDSLTGNILSQYVFIFLKIMSRTIFRILLLFV